MSNVFPCEDWRDIISLNSSFNLYLKPAACIHISVQLPAEMPPPALEAISTEEVMEKIKATARPDVLIGLKVLKTAQQYIRIEAHVHTEQQIPSVLERLDRSMLKLNNFDEAFKVRACRGKVSFATKQDWESFYRMNRNFLELKPGERPDTVHVRMLPCHWFASSTSSNSSTKIHKVKPSESVIRSVFESFGPIRNMDIPMLDPYRLKMFPNLENVISMGKDGVFDVYVQYHEYGGFIRCMTAFRGMILVLREGNKALAASIQVDFDRTRHLSDRSIKFRKTARERLIQEEIDKERAEKLKKGKEDPVAEENRPQNQNEQQKGYDASSNRDTRLKIEQNKMLLAQRRLESLRLLDAVVEQVKAVLDKSKQDSSKKKPKKDKETKRQSKLEKQEKVLRTRLLEKYKQIEQAKIETQKQIIQEIVQTSNGQIQKSSESQARPPSPPGSPPKRSSPSSSDHHTQEAERFSNGAPRPYYNRERGRSFGYRSNYNQGYDRRSDGHSGNYPRQNTLNRKRYQPANSLHSPTRQDSNRQDWKRNRYDSNQSKSNWESKADSELWDGPEIEFNHQNSRGSYGRGGRGGRDGGEFHHRQRGHENVNARMPRNELRNSGSSFGQSLPNPIERPV